MPRFWTKVLNSFRHNNKKRHSVFKHPHSPVNHTSNNSNGTTTTTDLSFDSSLSTCLTESKIYQDNLVKLDILEHALEDNMEAFFCTWNEELERIYEKCRWALDSLTCSLQELSYEICNITSPFQNPDQQSLSDVHQFISDYLKKWKVHHQRSDENNNNNNSTKESLLERMEFSFDIYYENLQSKGLAIKDPRLSHCIQQICQWEHDFFLFKQYFQSQMTILWNTILNQDTIQRLLQTRWNRRYNQCINRAQTLEDQMKTLLEQSSPSREDFICAICLSVLSEPVTITSCLHTFCRPCIQHFYCTCTSSSCPSTCHKTSRRQRPEQYYAFNNTSTTLKGKHHLHQQQQKRLVSRRIYSAYFPHKRHSSILYSKKKQKLLACQCYTSDELEDTLPLPTKSHTCPLCRSRFTLKDCIINVALDNFISLYFSYEEKVDDDNVNNNLTSAKRKTTAFDSSHGDNSEEQQPNQKGRRSVIYNAIHRPFSWLSSPPSSTNRQQQTTSRNSTHVLASSSSQHRQQPTVDTRVESSEEYDNVNRDLYNLARRSSWWF